MSKKTELAKNTLIILLGKTCTQLLSFLLLPLYTSYLITEEFGYIDLIITYITLLVPVLSLQLEMAEFRFLIDSRGNEEQTKKIISTCSFFLVPLSIVSMLLIIISNIFLRIKFFPVILGIIITTMISSNLLQIARGFGRTSSYSIASVINGGITIILNVLFIVIFQYGALGMLLAMLIANTISSIYLCINLRITRYINIHNYDKDLNKKILKYSIPLIPNSISWWIMSASDRTIISFILGVSSNGIYAVSNKFPAILNSFFGIFNLAWSESASKNIKEKDRDSYFSSVCNDIVWLFGTIGLFLIALLPFLFNYLIKKNYTEAYNYIPILIVSSIFSLTASQYGSFYIAKKETKKLSFTTFISALSNVIIHICLIKHIGLYAAAISTAISYFLITLYRHYDIKKSIIIKYNNKVIEKMTLMYILIIISYYLNIFIINIVSLSICIIFGIYYNKQFIINTKTIIKTHLFKKQKNN